MQELDASTALALDPALAEGYYWRACARAEAGHLSGAAADMRSCAGKLQHAERKRVAQQVSIETGVPWQASRIWQAQLLHVPKLRSMRGSCLQLLLLIQGWQNPKPETIEHTYSHI